MENRAVMIREQKHCTGKTMTKMAIYFFLGGHFELDLKKCMIAWHL